MPLLIMLVFGIMSLAQIVIFFYVLFKLFKEKGFLHALLGFFCGIYTFIWGWVRHRDLELTKVMLAWSVLMVLGVVMQSVLGGVMVSQFTKQMPGQMEAMQQEMQRQTAQMPQATPKRQPKTKAPAGTAPPSAGVDWLAKAKALVKDGEYTQPAQAVMYLSNAIQVNPRSAEAHNDRGLAYLGMKKLPQALQDFNQAIRLNTRYAEAFNNRGRTHYDMQNWNAALKDFSQAVALKGNYANAYLGRGLARYQLNQNAPACADFKKACTLGDCDAIQWAQKENVCP
jgi:hypothetical protein